MNQTAKHDWTACSQVGNAQKVFGSFIRGWRCPVCGNRANRKAFVAECNGNTIRKREILDISGRAKVIQI